MAAHEEGWKNGRSTCDGELTFINFQSWFQVQCGYIGFEFRNSTVQLIGATEVSAQGILSPIANILRFRIELATSMFNLIQPQSLQLQRTIFGITALAYQIRA
jgi:hypothetical protein